MHLMFVVYVLAVPISGAVGLVIARLINRSMTTGIHEKNILFKKLNVNTTVSCKVRLFCKDNRESRTQSLPNGVFGSISEYICTICRDKTHNTTARPVQFYSF